VRQFSRQFPVPTYVVEFMLGRYCATTDEQEIQEGWSIVQRQLSERTVRAGNEALIQSIAVKKARSRSSTSSRRASMPRPIPMSPNCHRSSCATCASAELVTEHQRMLTGGFYAEVTLGYDPTIAQEKTAGRSASMACARSSSRSATCWTRWPSRTGKLTTPEWKDFLLRSIGLEPAQLTERNKDAILLRMVPFVERNYNLVEIGPRGTGKSHLFQQVSPYAHLVSGGKATVARMFVNNANGQRGLVCQYDVVCFDEVSGISFDQKDGVNIMKGYMESGEFSRGKESIRADGSIVMVGNFDVDVEHQQRIGHLFQPLPPEMRDDTAFMDRIHCYLPGWDVPKLKPEIFTDHFGLVSDFLSECFTQLRNQSRLAACKTASSLAVRYPVATSTASTRRSAAF
jgi:ATP-dependent Lon protease